MTLFSGMSYDGLFSDGEKVYKRPDVNLGKVEDMKMHMIKLLVSWVFL